MSKLSIIASIIVAIILTGCQATHYVPKKYNVKNEIVINSSKSQAWSKVIEWYGKVNLTPSVMDQSSGYLQASFTLGKNFNDYCDCGYVKGGLESFYFENIQGRFNVTLYPVSEYQTRVRLNMTVSSDLNGYSFDKYRGWYLSSSSRINCNSIGTLEESLINELAR